MIEKKQSIQNGDEANKKQDLSWTTRWPEMALRTGNFGRGILLIVLRMWETNMLIADRTL